VIDFRYHLISIIAVLMSLAIGIFAGSGFLGGPLLDDLERRQSNLEERNREYRSDNQDLRGELSQVNDFVSAVEPMLVEDALLSENVVVLEFEGSDSDAIERLVEAIENAGGVPVARILLTEKFALEQETDLNQLALTVESTGSRAREVRRDAATRLGIAVARAGAFAGGEPRGVAAAIENLRALLDDLDRAGFVSVDQLDGESPVPPGTSFVIAGGSPDPAPYDVAAMAADLGIEISHQGNPVIVAEPSTSVWGLTTGIRGDEAAAQQVATADQADKIEGRIATVLGLAAVRRGDEPGHYGVGPDATALLPSPPPGE
jgi:cation diffusion facilitator CzcD-associated flavoprotein CzcO